jgi:chromosome segregation ATPase
VELTYTIGVADIIGRPLLMSAITGIILTGFIAWRITTRREEEKEVVEVAEEKPKKIIREFCKLYEDKTALTERLEQLELNYLKGKIRKIEYQKRRGIYLTELERVDRALKPIKENLSKATSSYAKIVTSIEELELEKETAQRQLQDLRNKYRDKRITAATYNKIKEELEKKVSKLSQEIDKKILGLRQEIS